MLLLVILINVLCFFFTCISQANLPLNAMNKILVIKGKDMNCHKISEAHVWRYSKSTKMRRCVKCKSRIAITEKEFNLKWGTKKTVAN